MDPLLRLIPRRIGTEAMAPIKEISVHVDHEVVSRVISECKMALSRFQRFDQLGDDRIELAAGAGRIESCELKPACGKHRMLWAVKPTRTQDQCNCQLRASVDVLVF